MSEAGNIIASTHRGVCAAEDKLTLIYTKLAFEVLQSIGEEFNYLHFDVVKRTVKEQIGAGTGR